MPAIAEQAMGSKYRAAYLFASYLVIAATPLQNESAFESQDRPIQTGVLERGRCANSSTMNTIGRKIERKKCSQIIALQALSVRSLNAI
jgi:hypothetical protein